MKFKFALSTATALGLLMGSAMANEATTTQTGNDNSAHVIQNVWNKQGQNNFVNATQILNRNTLKIDQSAATVGETTSGNRVNNALQTNAVLFGAGASVTDANSADIRQTGVGGNVINLVNQTRTGNGRNTIGISQAGTGNYIATASQIGSGNDMSVTVIGDDNGSATAAAWTRGAAYSGATQDSFLQNGTGHDIDVNIENGNKNRVGVRQLGTNNRAAGIVITGDENVVGVFQDGSGNDFALSEISGNSNLLGLRQIGVTNFATIDVNGDFNVGAADFTSATPAGLVGLTSGLMEQNGNDNKLGLGVVGGDFNVFASLQTGDDNVIVAAIDGGSNQLAIKQTGNSSLTSVNDADVSIDGGSNNVGLTQGVGGQSNANTVATIDVRGNNNHLDARQQQNGNATSTLTVNVTGNLNNHAGSSFTGVANSILFNRTPGLVEQGGSDNTASLNVRGNSNLFSVRQSSAGNNTTGVVIGNNNQAVVAQSGADTAVFVQIGSGNNLGIAQ